MVLLAALPALGLSLVTTYAAHLVLVCMFGLLTGVWIAATSPLLVRSVLHAARVLLKSLPRSCESVSQVQSLKLSGD